MSENVFAQQFLIFVLVVVIYPRDVKDWSFTSSFDLLRKCRRCSESVLSPRYSKSKSCRSFASLDFEQQAINGAIKYLYALLAN